MRLLLAGLAATALLTGCGANEDSVDAGQGSSGATTPTSDDSYVVADFGPFDLNVAVGRSHAAGVFEIREVGRAFDAGDETRPSQAPQSYREVRLVVREVLFDGDQLALSEGDEVTITAYGSGRSHSGDPHDVELISGPLSPGSTVLALLRRGEIPAGSARQSAVVLTEHARTTWIIDDSGTATSPLVPAAPADQLKELIRAEYENGSAADPRSAELFPPPSDTESSETIPHCIGEFCDEGG